MSILSLPRTLFLQTTYICTQTHARAHVRIYTVSLPCTATIMHCKAFRFPAEFYNLHTTVLPYGMFYGFFQKQTKHFTVYGTTITYLHVSFRCVLDLLRLLCFYHCVLCDSHNLRFECICL